MWRQYVTRNVGASFLRVTSQETLIRYSSLWDADVCVPGDDWMWMDVNHCNAWRLLFALRVFNLPVLLAGLYTIIGLSYLFVWCDISMCYEQQPWHMFCRHQLLTGRSELESDRHMWNGCTVLVFVVGQSDLKEAMRCMCQGRLVVEDVCSKLLSALDEDCCLSPVCFWRCLSQCQAAGGALNWQ